MTIEKQQSDLQRQVISYWHGFGSQYISDLLIGFDVKETLQATCLIDDKTWRSLESFYEMMLDLDSGSISAQDMGYLAGIFEQLPTAVMMYFMQNIYQKNKPLFQAIYQDIYSDKKFTELYARCLSFEKLIILLRAFDGTRMELFEKVVKALSEGYQ
ncbi:MULTISPECIES: hypothetical protein [Cysteiniphilum]|uniref:type IVB secretion system protein IcmW n=1 Tax=Cysteiniphilum TaxID=2056696 RepID=UPI00177F45FC|nr:MULTISPECIES: hypothetical protein [Cysteiniphilum]